MLAPPNRNHSAPLLPRVEDSCSDLLVLSTSLIQREHPMKQATNIQNSNSAAQEYHQCQKGVNLIVIHAASE